MLFEGREKAVDGGDGQSGALGEVGEAVAILVVAKHRENGERAFDRLNGAGALFLRCAANIHKALISPMSFRHSLPESRAMPLRALALVERSDWTPNAGVTAEC